MRKVERYCDKWDLKTGVRKTKIEIFRNGGGIRECYEAESNEVKSKLFCGNPG
jgi:hypothetical protein